MPSTILISDAVMLSRAYDIVDFLVQFPHGHTALGGCGKLAPATVAYRLFVLKARVAV